MKYINLIILVFIACSCKNTSDLKAKAVKDQVTLKALIIDGQNNHGIWPKTTIMMKDFLIDTKLFDVDVYRTNNTWQGPHSEAPEGLEDIKALMNMYPIQGTEENKVVEKPEPDENFAPDFSKYDVIISNLGWQAAPWPKATQTSFEKYMKEGGGLVVIHAANNTWPEWDEYNKMIGIGGWSDRNTSISGPQIFYDTQGKRKSNTKESACGSHGPQMEFVVENRSPQHPIMRGIPSKWLHTKDELYEKLCGPAENVTILATSFSDEEGNSPPWDETVKGSDRNEPVLLAIEYGKGRTFHSTLGHADYSMECIGFISTFTRGCEWAATGNVTQDVPTDFPTEEKISIRAYTK